MKLIIPSCIFLILLLKVLRIESIPILKKSATIKETKKITIRIILNKMKSEIKAETIFLIGTSENQQPQEKSEKQNLKI